MPTLNWIGKDKVVNHHLDVPFRTLEKEYTFASEGQNDSGNMIIHGDNLDAQKALLPKYEGGVKCIYIVIRSWYYGIHNVHYEAPILLSA